jgi:NADPH2:quinone reductase
MFFWISLPNRLGHLISYGDISGKLDPIEPSILMTKGSLSFRRTSLRHFITPRKALEATAAELFDMVEKENIKIRVNHIYPLSDTHLAHRDLERGMNVGSTILLP